MTTSHLRAVLASAAALGACAAPRPRDVAPAIPAIDYRLAYDPNARDPVWRVELRGHGLAGTEGLALDLEDWGEWTSVDSYFLRELESDPPLHRVLGSRTRFGIDPPAGWSGELRVTYSLATTELGSAARDAHGLLPYRAPSYSFGFSTNTLFHVVWRGMPEEVARSITIEAPPDWTIASGFGGVSIGRQTATMPASIGNTIVSFGRPRGVATSSGATPLEIVQWGGANDVTAPLLAFARAYVDACTESTGAPPMGPIRLVVTEPGFGGTRVDGAIAIGCPAGFDRDRDAGTLHFLAHEIFHDWLGGRVRSGAGDESLCWFWEGFTEYLSLWQLARLGLVSREWFAERLATYDRIASQAKGRDALAYADSKVPWRDSEVEPLAYQGSALVAFSLDAALRRAGKPGLVSIVRDFAALPDGRFVLDDIRRWVEGHGLAELWTTRFETAPPHTVRDDLLAIGFVPKDMPEPITYIGVQIEGDGPFGAVVAVDPEGPAAGIVRVGDYVNGLTPTRDERPAVSASVASEYRFGLEWYDPKAERVRVDVERDGTRVELWVKPRIVDGGVASRLAPDEAKLAAFFR